MSGGRFDYNDWHVYAVAESIDNELSKMGKEIPEDERGYYYYFDGKYPDYPDEVKQQFRKAVRYLRIAYILVHRIDWLLSGDHGEDTFLEILDYDLKEIGLSLDNLPEI